MNDLRMRATSIREQTLSNAVPSQPVFTNVHYGIIEDICWPIQKPRCMGLYESYSDFDLSLTFYIAA